MFGILRHVCYCDDNCPMPRDGCMSDQWVNSKINWRSRIVRYGKIRADQVAPHPQNPRKHPIKQRQMVEASFDTLGQIAPIMINERNGYLVDGEERTWLALAQGPDAELDAVWVDLTEEEHALAITIFDRITNEAYYDKDNLDDLMHQIDTDNAALQSLLASMAAQEGLIPPIDPRDEWVGMPEFEQEAINAYHDIRVVFESANDMQAFSQLVGQTITDKTTSIYYPRKAKREIGVYQEEDDES